MIGDLVNEPSRIARLSKGQAWVNYTAAEKRALDHMKSRMYREVYCAIARRSLARFLSVPSGEANR